MKKKERLDILLVESGLAESRSQAQKLIMAGEVLVEGQQAYKPSQFLLKESKIEIKNKPRYVSRGGYKLEKALDYFGFLDLSGKVCVDVGASTGGFTDGLLQRNAERVYAIDVGYGQLHNNLRNSPKVVVMERTNVKDINKIPDFIDLVVIDASFISLKSILPVVFGWDYKRYMDVIALVKPQFEAGKKEAAKGKGVIKSDEIRRRILNEIIDFATKIGFDFQGFVESPIQGPKGNLEYLIYLKRNI